ncbi:hypothetical protein GCM10007094_26620 [Pseudovibrio japonicus]|uniref:Uncharacterized protein n=1 Tax=Pseudovibrio japonicus TaxID=366534 RepID=A0ABQ3EEN8_9HYPH|nr:hypothetical protein [Pseudovibrio japonicus]GHB35699.1 hypothetical protein GCM10007094_26620 [Pseudovibrio japonicus]
MEFGALEITQIVSIASALFAGGSFIAAAWQLKLARLIQREAVANQIYAEYLKLAVQNPDWASGKMPSNDREFEQYEWFASYMLNACEQMLEVLPKSQAWRNCVRDQLRYHREYLSQNEWFCSGGQSHYGGKMADALRAVRKEVNA